MIRHFFRRYKFEILTVITVAGVSVYSSLQLLDPSTASTATEQKGKRAISSVTQEREETETYQTRCRPEGEIFVTTATRIRIVGPYCAPAVINSKDQSKGQRKIAKLSPAVQPEVLVNNTSLSPSYPATIFHNSVDHRFSTDFIPVRTGTNHILLQFRAPATAEPFHLNISVEKKGTSKN